MYSKKPSILACVTGQYDCDRIVSDELEYLNKITKENGADMTVIFSAYAPAAAAQFVTENNVNRIVTGMHDGGNQSFLVMFNRFAPEVSITMVTKDHLIYSMDVSKAHVR